MKNWVHKRHDLFDVSAILLKNAFETTSPFTDASSMRDFPLRFDEDQNSN